MKLKKRFNFIERNASKKEIQTKIKDYKHLTYQYKFLKFLKQEFYFVGNIRNVKNIYLIPYNTKRGYLWFTQKYFPFNVVKEGCVNIVARFVPALILYFILILMVMVSLLFIPYNEIVLMLVLYAVMFIVLPLALVGVGTRNNVASGDACLKFAFEMLEKMDSTQRNKIGFLFVDTSKRQTVMKAIANFFQENNKAPLLIEGLFHSGDDQIGIASTKFQSKQTNSFAKKHHLHYEMLETYPEYYTYVKYVLLSYGKLDKKNDFVVSYSLKNKETFNQNQYDKFVELLQLLGADNA